MFNHSELQYNIVTTWWFSAHTNFNYYSAKNCNNSSSSSAHIKAYSNQICMHGTYKGYVHCTMHMYTFRIIHQNRGEKISQRNLLLPAFQSLSLYTTVYASLEDTARWWRQRWINRHISGQSFCLQICSTCFNFEIVLMNQHVPRSHTHTQRTSI